MTITEHSAVAYLAETRRATTFEIRRACGLVSTVTTRLLLQRLRRTGLVQDLPSTDGIARWAITDAGRRAVRP